MNYPAELLFYGLDNTAQLLQRVCVVLIAAYVSIRMVWLRQAFNALHLWRNRLILALFFGVFAIIGTHSGFLIDVHHVGRHIAWPTSLSEALKQSQAVIGFRDLMVLAAGLTGGVWVGLGAGIIAGCERYLLGGFAGTASAFATILQGVLAGWIFRRYPRWAASWPGAGATALIGTVIQKLTLLLWVKPYADALRLVMETSLPVAIVNTAGVVLFLIVMQDLERDREKVRREQAELRAWNAQIDPHFMNNTLNNINALIHINADLAAKYVVKLAGFMDDTRRHVGVNSIQLGQEMKQVERYLEFQNLRFQETIALKQTVNAELVHYQIPPRCLQTLVENALLHGMQGKAGELIIEISAADNHENLSLAVRDNGVGISAIRLAELGKRLVVSSKGNGSALYHLQQSLLLAFHGKASMLVNSQEGQGTEIILTIPKRTTPW